MWDTWNEVFKRTLGFPERSLVSEIRDWRNKWAHQQTFSSDDTDRALDSIERLLTAVSAEQAEEVRRMKLELRRLVADEQARGERRKSAGIAIEGQPRGHLKPWREVITPHPTWPAGATSRRNSPPTCGRCIWARARTNTANRRSSSVAPS
jgi:hypothetical protein